MILLIAAEEHEQIIQGDNHWGMLCLGLSSWDSTQTNKTFLVHRGAGKH